MVHCSGGAQTKILHFVEKLHIIKDNLFPVPPVSIDTKAHQNRLEKCIRCLIADIGKWNFMLSEAGGPSISSKSLKIIGVDKLWVGWKRALLRGS
jgi:hypothetical protein